MMKRKISNPVRELQELARTLKECERRISHLPNLFKNYYLQIPDFIVCRVRSARLGLEETIEQVERENSCSQDEK